MIIVCNLSTSSYSKIARDKMSAPAEADKNSQDVKFDTLLAIIKESGSRIRSNVYINIVLIGIAIACARNYNHPSWDLIHFQNSRDITFCISELDDKKSLKDVIGNANAIGDKCLWFIKTRFELTDEEIARKLKMKDDLFRSFIVKAMTNELNNRTSREYFQIPLLGLSFHQNDTWLITGFFLNVSFAMLFLFLKKDAENLRFMIGEISCARSQYAVLSSHIFSAPQLNPLVRFTIYPLFLGSLYLLPGLIHAYTVHSNLTGNGIELLNYYLINYSSIKGWDLPIEIFFQIFSGLILLIIGLGCLHAHLKIKNALKAIRGIKFLPKPSRVNSDLNSKQGHEHQKNLIDSLTRVAIFIIIGNLARLWRSGMK